MNKDYYRQAERIVRAFDARQISITEFNSRMLALNRKYRVYPVLERRPELFRPRTG